MKGENTGSAVLSFVYPMSVAIVVAILLNCSRFSGQVFGSFENTVASNRRADCERNLINVNLKEKWWNGVLMILFTENIRKGQLITAFNGQLVHSSHSLSMH